MSPFPQPFSLYTAPRPHRVTPSEALASDWQAVGGDMRRAMGLLSEIAGTMDEATAITRRTRQSFQSLAATLRAHQEQRRRHLLSLPYSRFREERLA